MFALRQMLSASLILGLVSAAHSVAAQSPNTATGTLPRYVSFTGELKNQQGNPANGIVNMKFLLYEQESGGEPLWSENQRVTVDAQGHFTVTLGANSTDGVPIELFTATKPRWLAMEPDGLPMPQRVLLLSVPYALKAGDAQTLGGLPASAFLLAGQSRGGIVQNPAPGAAQPSPGVVSATTSNVTTSGGAVNALPLFTTGTNIESSAITQTGTGPAAKIGVNTRTPAATLDVNGAATIRGTLNLAAAGTATAGAGANSRLQMFTASAFNSNSSVAVLQKFQWQAEPAANNTAAPSGTLNLLYGSGTAVPAETGLKLSSKGLFTFAPGQTFPGAGTITGVTAGTALTGGGTSGAVTVNLDTSKVPLLLAANSFTGNQSITGNLTATGGLTVGSINAAAASFTGPVTFSSGQAFPGTIAGVTAGTGLISTTTNGNVALSLDPNFSDSRYAQVGGFNSFSGIQLFNNFVGIGVVFPAYPLHVNGAMRSETGLSLGGNAPLQVDAPGIVGGHFVVDGTGNVGINKPSPTAALDIVGSVNATGALHASSLVAPNGLSTGSVTIGNDPTMSSAPHMYLTGYLPGPLAALSVYRAIFAIPTKNIVVTRLTSAGFSSCPAFGPLTFSLWTNTGGFVYTINLNAASATDSGAISIPVAAGTKVYGQVNTPDCGPFGVPPTDIPVSIEYVMQ